MKEEFAVEVILDLIEGSQDDVRKTQLSLHVMSTSTTEISIILFWAEGVGPPMSVVKVVVDEAIWSYLSVYSSYKNQGIQKPYDVLMATTTNEL